MRGNFETDIGNLQHSWIYQGVGFFNFWHSVHCFPVGNGIFSSREVKDVSPLRLTQQCLNKRHSQIEAWRCLGKRKGPFLRALRRNTQLSSFRSGCGRWTQKSWDRNLFYDFTRLIILIRIPIFSHQRKSSDCERPDPDE